jgi:integrase
MSQQQPPLYSKWHRKRGGFKVCRQCGHRNPESKRIGGKVIRPKQCLNCLADLPEQVTCPKNCKRTWYVHEFDPNTGKERDIKVASSEAADVYIAQKRRDWTTDPVQRDLLEHCSTLIRGIEATTRDEAIDALIVRLGGEVGRRALEPIGWKEAIDTVCKEMADTGMSDDYVTQTRRVCTDLGIVAGLTDWAAVNLAAAEKYRAARLAGGWEREGETVKAVGGRAWNGDLATLSAFLTRAAKKRWVSSNLPELADLRVKVKAIRVKYMPDADLRQLLEKSAEKWLRAAILLTYYTGARRGDLLRMEWDKDIDHEGLEGRTGPHIYVYGNKGDTPHWTPLHPAAVEALKELRAEPKIGPNVFFFRGLNTEKSKTSHMSKALREACTAAGLAHNWTLTHIRKKGNTDLRNLGASPKERATIRGHRTVDVNERHYEAILPDRERALIDGMPAFGLSA